MQNLETQNPGSNQRLSKVTRRSFIHSSSILAVAALTGANVIPQPGVRSIMTVNGLVEADTLGQTLIHEHILVDFIGASDYDPSRWDDDEVIKKVLPYLAGIRKLGCRTLVDCTPNYLGRDVLLLRKLSEISGIHIVTNTGYYGGSDPKYLPEHAFSETAEQLAYRWIAEWENGIDGTAIKPGFMKISVNAEHLSPISQKLIRAAAIAHLKTGLTIFSHTGPAVPALEEIEILKNEGVAPEAFVWVHAQNEKDWNQRDIRTAARAGAWISLDGLNDGAIQEYTEMITFLKKRTVPSSGPGVTRCRVV